MLAPTDFLRNLLFTAKGFDDVVVGINDLQSKKTTDEVNWMEIWRTLTLVPNQKIFKSEQNYNLQKVVQKINAFYPIKECEKKFDLVKYALADGKLDYALMLLQEGATYHKEKVAAALRALKKNQPQVNVDDFLNRCQEIEKTRREQRNNQLNDQLTPLVNQQYDSLSSKDRHSFQPPFSPAASHKPPGPQKN